MGTILLIEDSITERTIITDFCKTLGINVTIATSGEEGLEKLHHNYPDVIVLDVVLPGKSGFEICREIKATEQTKTILLLNPSIKIFLTVPYNNF